MLGLLCVVVVCVTNIAEYRRVDNDQRGTSKSRDTCLSVQSLLTRWSVGRSVPCRRLLPSSHQFYPALALALAVIVMWPALLCSVALVGHSTDGPVPRADPLAAAALIVDGRIVPSRHCDMKPARPRPRPRSPSSRRPAVAVHSLAGHDETLRRRQAPWVRAITDRT